jgi:hypothetical protein
VLPRIPKQLCSARSARQVEKSHRKSTSFRQNSREEWKRENGLAPDSAALSFAILPAEEFITSLGFDEI